MCIGEDMLIMKVGSESWQFASNQDEGPHLKTHLAQLNLPSRHHTTKTQLQLSDSQEHMQLQQVCSFPPTDPGEEIKNCYQRGCTTSGFHKPTENQPMFNLQYSFIQKLNLNNYMLGSTQDC